MDYHCNRFADGCVFCRMTQVTSRMVTERLGGASKSWHRQQPLAIGYAPGNVCKFWLSGTCTRNPCRFLHPDKVAPRNVLVPSNSLKATQYHNQLKPQKAIKRRTCEEQNLRKGRQRTSPEAVDSMPSVECGNDCTQKPLVKQSDVGRSEKPSDAQKVVCTVKNNDGDSQKLSAVLNGSGSEKVQREICKRWINKSCVDGEKCEFLHSWSSTNEFSKMVQLEGHQKAVTGINLPAGSDKLFTSSEDGTVRMWDCNTGECISVANMGAPVWCLESEGPWVLAGTKDMVKAWNIETHLQLSADAPGQVYSLVFCEETLFAGLEDGSIFRWQLNSNVTSFDSPTLLKGHTGAVVSLSWGVDLYSGSLDKTIRVWNRKTLHCIYTVQKHSEMVTSVLGWKQYLFSSSLDKTLKVWGLTEAGELDVTYTHNEDNSILSLSGMPDGAGNPILLCSLSDNSVRLYDLPSFNERGRIFSKEETRTIHIGPKGLFFTGDETGVVSVWRCSGDFSGSLDKVAAA